MLTISLLFFLSQEVLSQSAKTVVYPIVISFQSECCGVPSDKSVRDFIRSFKKKNKIKTITAEHIGPMGREGEYYLAFKLKELNKKQSVSFIRGIKKVEKMPGDKGILVINENMEIDQAEISQRAGSKIIKL